MNEEIKIDTLKLKNFLRSINTKYQAKRKDYVINKWLFRIGNFLYYVFAFATILTNWTAFTTFYLECPMDAPIPCNNPFYNQYGEPTCDEWYCKEPVLLQGTSIGTNANWLYPNGIYLALIFWIMPYFLNHWAYNKKNKFWVTTI